MCRLLAVLAIAGTLSLSGCGGEPRPEADPNWKPTTNPSDITIPDQMRKTSPGAPGQR